MSADNGIYILKTPSYPIKKDNCYTNRGSYYEYRVAYAMAIDNVDYSDLYLPALFGNSPVFQKEDEAWNYAKQLEEDCDYLEYGICLIEKDFYPNITSRAALKALDCYVGAEPVDILE